MASDHPTLADDAARRKAITVHDRTFLVEAGAGSGKTAVLAGRIAMMLAAGIAPKHIAAVTFTELAASELLIRVRQFAGALLADEIPTELRIALPEGLSSAQRDHLQLASETLDEITCSTIHGFCQHLIKPYPVAADIDPGAAIMDRDQSDMTFDEVVDTWLRAELDQEDESLLGDLVWQDRDETLKLIRTILKHLRKHRELRVATPADFPPLVRAACQETDRFSEFLRSLGAEEPETAALASGLAQLARHAHGDTGTGTPISPTSYASWSLSAMRASSPRPEPFASTETRPSGPMLRPRRDSPGPRADDGRTRQKTSTMPAARHGPRCSEQPHRKCSR